MLVLYYYLVVALGMSFTAYSALFYVVHLLSICYSGLVIFLLRCVALRYLLVHRCPISCFLMVEQYLYFVMSLS
jgi:hypothetical protein